MNGAATDSVSRVRALVVELLALDSIDVDAHLIDSGLLDSFALIELLTAIEEEFALDLALEDLDLEVLRSVRSIAAYVETLRGSVEPRDG